MRVGTALFATFLSSALVYGAAPGWAAGPAVPTVDTQAPEHGYQVHSLRLSGPRHVVAGKGYDYTVVERGSRDPAKGAKIFKIGGKGSVKVGPSGTLPIQFAGPGTYKMIAKRGDERSNVLVVRVR